MTEPRLWLSKRLANDAKRDMESRYGAGKENRNECRDFQKDGSERVETVFAVNESQSYKLRIFNGISSAVVFDLIDEMRSVHAIPICSGDWYKFEDAAVWKPFELFKATCNKSVAPF